MKIPKNAHMAASHQPLPHEPRRFDASPRAAFTLVEIILVVVIIGIASAVAVPTFAKSFKGAKLRSSVRMVLSMHRQAQSKAVLGQQYVSLLFDLRKGTVEMVEQSRSDDMKDAFFDSLGTASSSADSAAPASGEDAAAVSSALVRKLEDAVAFSSFSGGREIDDIHYVTYYPNGMCEGYTVSLADADSRRKSVRIDPVTAKAKVSDD